MASHDHKYRPSAVEWNSVRALIEQIYLHPGNELADVTRHLERIHCFRDVTPRMVKSKIKAWQLDQKTIREPDWQFMFQEYVRITKETPQVQPEFVVRGLRRKGIKDIRTYMRRRKVSEAAFLLPKADAADFPHIRVIPNPPLLPPSPVSRSLPTSPLNEIRDGLSDLADARAKSEGFCPSRPASKQPGIGPPQPPPRDYNYYVIPSPPTSTLSALRIAAQPEHLTTSSPKMEAGYEAPPLENGHGTTNAVSKLETYADSGLHGAGQALPKPPPLSAPTAWQERRSEPPALTNDQATPTWSAIKAELEQDNPRAFPRQLLDLSGNMDRPSASTGQKMVPFWREDDDEYLAGNWALRCFLAATWDGQDLNGEHLRRPNQLLWRMLELETQRTNATNSLHPRGLFSSSSFIFTGLALIIPIFYDFGQTALLERILTGSIETIHQFFQQDRHNSRARPFAVPYSYNLNLLRASKNPSTLLHQNYSDELWSAFRDAQEIWGEKSPNALVMYYYYAWELLRGELPGALEALWECVELSGTVLGPSHYVTLQCHTTYARARFELGDRDGAIKILLGTIEASKNCLNVANPSRLQMIERLALWLTQLGKLDLAEEKWVEVLEGRKKVLGLKSTRTWYAIEELCNLLKQRGKASEAERLKEESFQQYNAGKHSVNPDFRYI